MPEQNKRFFYTIFRSQSVVFRQIIVTIIVYYYSAYNIIRQEYS